MNLYIIKVRAIRLTTIILCAVSLSNCKKNDDEHTIPAVSVNINLSTNLPQYNDLNFIGGTVILEGGYNGIIVFRPSNEEIKAFDRQAPYEVANACQLNIDSTGWIAIDTCSGSRWLLSDGLNIEGPAFYPLKEYQTYYDGNTLNIYN